jgi:hypothetical protein
MDLVLMNRRQDNLVNRKRHGISVQRAFVTQLFLGVQLDRYAATRAETYLVDNERMNVQVNARKRSTA